MWKRYPAIHALLGKKRLLGGYGFLYNWYAVQTNKLALTGWHIPTNAEWATLYYFLGGDDLVGGKLKEVGYTHWFYPNTGALDIVGFRALPAGYKENTEYIDLGYSTTFWSNTENETYPTEAKTFGLDNELESCIFWSHPKWKGFSIRCIRNNSSGYIEGTHVADSEGNFYDTKTIGTQIWMLQNLKVTKYNDGSSIPEEPGNFMLRGDGVYAKYNNVDIVE
jgi:uncharacterized protein (TIGR02145 family)